MPETVLNALRRFEVEARANVHEVAHRRARAATEAYQHARGQVARFLNANSAYAAIGQALVFAPGRARRPEPRVQRLNPSSRVF
jgi:hypothetical protein